MRSPVCGHLKAICTTFPSCVPAQREAAQDNLNLDIATANFGVPQLGPQLAGGAPPTQ